MRKADLFAWDAARRLSIHSYFVCECGLNWKAVPVTALGALSRHGLYCGFCHA